jgi:hypothetical protein
VVPVFILSVGNLSVTHNRYFIGDKIEWPTNFPPSSHKAECTYTGFRSDVFLDLSKTRASGTEFVVPFHVNTNAIGVVCTVHIHLFYVLFAVFCLFFF